MLFLDVADGREHLSALAAAALAYLDGADATWCSERDRPFEPHLTIAKLSKLRSGGGGSVVGSGSAVGIPVGGGGTVVRISRSAYEAHEAADAGHVVAAALQLCVMEERQRGAYYTVRETLSLAEL